MMMNTISSITARQKRAIMTLASSCLKFERDIRLSIISDILNKEVESITLLSEEEAQKVILFLDFLDKFIETHYENLENHFIPDCTDIRSLQGFGETQLKLSKWQQIDIVSYLYNMNLSLDSLSFDSKLENELWELYRFTKYFIDNHNLSLKTL